MHDVAERYLRVSIACFCGVAFLMGAAAGPIVHPYLVKDFPKWCADHGALK